jgi:hypothetical protein
MYDRAEIVEDRTAKKIRVFIFAGINITIEPARDLAKNLNDSDVDKLRDEITLKYGIPRSQIIKRIKGGFSP